MSQENSNLTLPERPNLEQLRKQARELQRTESVTLSDAQRQLARQYGFPSWPALKKHIERLTGAVTFRDAWIEAALGGQLETANQLRVEHPEIWTDPLVRLMSGERVTLDVQTATGPRDWVPLLYVCFARTHQDPALQKGLREVVEDLLAQGADPNAMWIHPEYPEPPQTCLAGVCAVNHHPEVVEMLLRYGADPNDGEALYHGTEFPGLAGVRHLFAAGGNPKGSNGLAHLLDRESPEDLAVYLAAYGEPDAELHRALHHAINRRRSAACIELLLKAGADGVGAVHGLTPYLRAMLMGQEEIGELILSRGPIPALSEGEERVVSAVRGLPDVSGAEPPLHTWPALTYAAEAGDEALVERLLAVGISAAQPGDWGLTPLHHAAVGGRTAIVERLLKAGADLSARDPAHNGTPFNWCAYGCGVRWNRFGDYLGTVRLMLEAGAIHHCGPEFVLQHFASSPVILELVRTALADADLLPKSGG